MNVFYNKPINDSFLDNSNSHFLSLADAARKYGVSPNYLRFLIFKKRLRGVKQGKSWYTKSEWLEEYFQTIIPRTAQITQTKSDIPPQQSEKELEKKLLTIEEGLLKIVAELHRGRVVEKTQEVQVARVEEPISTSTVHPRVRDFAEESLAPVAFQEPVKELFEKSFEGIEGKSKPQGAFKNGNFLSKIFRAGSFVARTAWGQFSHGSLVAITLLLLLVVSVQGGIIQPAGISDQLGLMTTKIFQSTDPKNILEKFSLTISDGKARIDDTEKYLVAKISFLISTPSSTLSSVKHALSQGSEALVASLLEAQSYEKALVRSFTSTLSSASASLLVSTKNIMTLAFLSTTQGESLDQENLSSPQAKTCSPQNLAACPDCNVGKCDGTSPLSSTTQGEIRTQGVIRSPERTSLSDSPAGEYADFASTDLSAQLFTPFGQSLYRTLSQGLTSIKTLLTEGVDSVIAFFSPKPQTLALRPHETLKEPPTPPSSLDTLITDTKQKLSLLPPSPSSPNTPASSSQPQPAPSRITLSNTSLRDEFQTKLDALNLQKTQELKDLATLLLSVQSKANAVDTRASNIVQIISNSQKIDTLDKITVSNGLTLSSGNFAVNAGSLSVSGGATIGASLTVDTVGSFGGALGVGGNLTVTGTVTSNGTGTSTFAGPVSIAGILTVNSSSLTISSTSTVTTQFTVTRSPISTHTFSTWSPGVSNSNVTDSSLLINPSSASPDTNLFGLAVNSSPVFLIDSDGDVFAKSVTLSGGATLATTTIGGNLTIEGNSTFGDAPNNDSTLFNGYTRFFATSTQPALTIWNSSSGNLLSLQTGASSATDIFTVDHNGQTTIGTGTPAGLSTLTVAATTTTSIPLTLKGVSGQTANLLQALYSDNTSALTLTNTGLFGIGTGTPAFTLSVNGNALLGTTTVQGLTATGTIAVQGSGTSTFANGITTGGILSTNGLTIQGGNLLSSGLLTVTHAGTSSFSGGISTGGLSSSNGLTVSGGSFLSSVPFTNTSSATSTFSGFLTVSGTNSTSTFSGGLTTATLNVTSSTATSTFANGIQLGGGCFQDTTGACVINPWTVGSGNISYSGGNVGVGTSSPASLLSVQGNGYFSGTGFFGGAITGTSTISIQSTTATSTFSTGGLTVGTNQFVVQQTSGSVGIGSTTPSANLAITSTGNRPLIMSGSGDLMAVVRTTGGANNAGIAFENLGDATDSWTMFRPSDGSFAIVRSAGAVSLDGAGNTYLQLTAAGAVRVTMPGTQNTIAACHATDGTTSEVGSNDLRDCSGAPSDIAEWYDTISDVELGDIVTPSTSLGNAFNYSSGIGDVFDKDGHKTEGVPLPGATTTISVLSKSTSPYQSTILGIVSTAPYQTFGEDVKNTASHPHRIALVGRVPVKISTESGPIKAGDRITSSSLPGTGMKATSDGITIGIALQDFDPSNSVYGIGSSASTTQVSGNAVFTGKVLVYVNLGYSKLDSSASQLAQSSSSNTTNAFSIDQSSGKVNVSFYGNLNLQGNDINDVGAIRGMFNKWSIDGEGNMVVNEIKTKKLEVGSSEEPSGITIYDKQTKQPSCLVLEGGALLTISGTCDSSGGSSEPSSAPSSTELDSATTTSTAPPSEPDNATTTTPEDNTATSTSP